MGSNSLAGLSHPHGDLALAARSRRGLDAWTRCQAFDVGPAGEGRPGRSLPAVSEHRDDEARTVAAVPPTALSEAVDGRVGERAHEG